MKKRIQNPEKIIPGKPESDLTKSLDQLENKVKERTAEFLKTVKFLEAEMVKRINAEKKANERSKILEAFFQHTITPLVILDKDFNFIRVNEAYARACSRDISEFQGHNYFEFYPNEENEEIFRQVVKSGKPFTAYGKPFFFPDHPEWGTTYWNATLVPIFDEQGQADMLVFSLEDVTAKTIADMKLRLSEEKYRELVQNAQSIIFRCDLKGHIIFINEFGLKFFGYTQEELIGRNIIGTIVPEKDSSGRNLKNLIKDIILNPVGYAQNENENMLKNGNRVWVNWSNRIIENQRGPEILSVGADITNRKKYEAYITATNALLKLFIERIPRESYLKSAAAIIRDWSKCKAAAIRIVSFDTNFPLISGVGISKAILDSINHAACKKTSCPCIRVIKHQSKFYDTLTMTNKGSFFCPNLDEYIKRISKGKRQTINCPCLNSGFKSIALVPVGYKEQILGIIQIFDKRPNVINAEMVETIEYLSPLIGEAMYRFSVEQKLKESQEHLRMVVSNSPVMFFAIDKNGTITFSEGSGLKATGTKPEELIGKNIFIDFAKYRESNESVRKTLTTGEISHVEVASPNEKIFDFIISPVREVNNTISGVICVGIDITMRKQAEEKIKEYESGLRSLTTELLLTEEKERRRIAEALHDSIGPLLSFSERELGNLEKSAPGQISKSLEEVKNYIGDAVRQTRSLTFSLSPASLYDLGFEAAIEELAEQFAKEQKLKIFFRNSRDEKPLTQETRILLYRSVRELLINIAKHAKAKNAWISLGRKDDNIEISIRDDGIGFSKSGLESRLKSNGFGLFSIRERLTHLGGWFNIESTSGKGTKVILKAPLNLGQK